MFRRKSLPVGVLVMLLVLALASLGVGYGLWSKTLYVNGHVETGNVDAEISLGNVWDNEVEEVGSCQASLLDLDGDKQADDKVEVAVTKAYPSYECMVSFEVHSMGSIPVLVYQPVFTQLPPAEEVTMSLENCYTEPTQLHQREVAYCTLYIHVEPDAKPNTIYLFDAQIEARQFNEPRP